MNVNSVEGRLPKPVSATPAGWLSASSVLGKRATAPPPVTVSGTTATDGSNRLWSRTLPLNSRKTYQSAGGSKRKYSFSYISLYGRNTNRLSVRSGSIDIANVK